ncbi:WD40 repeat domain-containing protein [Virgisporangium aurantiacum]|uniref:WD40 repeat domain-containing protein n=1 Tax=Virgisporangium aurantiacum TaxID=175570 RepID=A0A8J4E316_9ACTN|nr:hypothetical protein [Virgisporangium aurantiacum]GIJ57552.1 hypothetical protein Vau01_050680 [Virgisporangium aurantiacum]
MLGAAFAVLLVVACGGVAFLVVNRGSGAARDAAPCEVVAATITVTGAVEGLPDVTFSADGRTVATSGQPVQLWNADTGAPLKNLTHRFRDLTVMAFSPDGKALAMASDKTRIRDFLGFEPTGAAAGQGGMYPLVLWNVETGGPGDLYPHGSPLDGVEFSRDGASLATIEGDDVYLWDRTGRTRGPQALPVTEPHVGGVVFSPDGKLVAVASSLGAVVLYDPATRRAVRTFEKFGDRYTQMRFSPDGAHLAIHNGGAPLKIWNLTTGAAVAQLDLAADDYLVDFVYSADGRSLVTLDQTTDYRRWDAATGQQTGRVRKACGRRNAVAAQYGTLSPDATRATGVDQRTAGGPKQVEVVGLPF